MKSILEDKLFRSMLWCCSTYFGISQVLIFVLILVLTLFSLSFLCTSSLGLIWVFVKSDYSPSDSPHWVCVCVCVLVVQSCPTLCDPMDCSPPGSSVHGILQPRILEWIAVSPGHMEQPHTEQLIVKEELGVAYPLLTYSRVYKVGRCCWKHSYCVYRVSSAKLPEVRQLTKGIDSAHMSPLPQVMPVWTVDGVWCL